ncbi:hypothetical protein JR316_0004221 [Psilocybe cubensis]|uniref:Secreted protein n=2 Tax=Psilocybe cubensis TaxID=181762 RepID=A0A8H8CKE6_PSICU|nr:hypothetical protein JR316_0004221 [Psilocybe cubensis]KAH9482126.1 hypothetical protein JR316_0004221 [Psilocybe cubensis]
MTRSIFTPLLSVLFLLLLANFEIAFAQGVADIPLTVVTTTPTPPNRQAGSFSGGRPGWDPRWGIGPVIPPPGVLDELKVDDSDPPSFSDPETGDGNAGDTSGDKVDPPSDE